MDRRYLVLNNETVEQEQALNNFLQQGGYNYMETQNASTFYAIEFLEFWGDTIESNMKSQLGRVPEGMTQEYLINAIEDHIVDNENNIMEALVDVASSEFINEDDRINRAGKICASHIQSLMYPTKVSNDNIDKLLAGVAEEFRNLARKR